MGKIYSAKMDLFTSILWLLGLSLPIFFITYGILSFDWLLMIIGLALNSIGTVFFIWPFMSAFYELDDDGLVVKYWNVKSYPYELIKSVKKADGLHKFALSGFGYYCTNFKTRVLINVNGKEIAISPDNPDEFVKELRERVKLISHMYKMVK